MDLCNSPFIISAYTSWPFHTCVRKSVVISSALLPRMTLRKGFCSFAAFSKGHHNKLFLINSFSCLHTVQCGCEYSNVRRLLSHNQRHQFQVAIPTSGHVFLHLHRRTLEGTTTAAHRTILDNAGISLADVPEMSGHFVARDSGDCGFAVVRRGLRSAFIGAF